MHVRNGRLKYRLAPVAVKKIAPLIGAGILFVCAENSAYAINGNIFILSCACQTTSDFSAAAIQESNGLGWGGTFLAVSTSQASTSLMHVGGKHLVDKFGQDYWLATYTTPEDDAGNSLAGNSESALQGFYQSYDQTTFGVSRSTPATIKEPTDYAGSFINSTEEEVEPGIGVALGQLGINPASIAVGTVITVQFADGSSAQYVKVSSMYTYQWTWNGIAHNAQHQLIDRSGNVKANPNSSGSGGGHAESVGFGQGANWRFDVEGSAVCTSVTTITVGGEATDYAYVHPC